MQEFKSLTDIKADNNMLDKEYDKALKDEYFKKIVSKLKLNSDILKNYTSLLEESACEYKNCCNCKGFVFCQNKIDGFAYLPKIIEGNLSFEYKPCKYKKAELKKIQSFKWN